MSMRCRAGIGGLTVLVLLVMSGCSSAEMLSVSRVDAAYAGKFESPAVSAEGAAVREAAVEAPVVEAVAAEVEAPNRLVVYNAVINVVVERVSDSLVGIRKALTQMGGYMHTMSNDSITMKVPGGRFHEAVDAIERCGCGG